MRPAASAVAVVRAVAVGDVGAAAAQADGVRARDAVRVAALCTQRADDPHKALATFHEAHATDDQLQHLL